MMEPTIRGLSSLLGDVVLLRFLPEYFLCTTLARGLALFFAGLPQVSSGTCSGESDSAMCRSGQRPLFFA